MLYAISCILIICNNDCFKYTILYIMYDPVEENRSIVDIASGIVLLVIDQVGWEQADMRLEDSAVARYFMSFILCCYVHMCVYYLPS
jgi:hypothetical protein